MHKLKCIRVEHSHQTALLHNAFQQHLADNSALPSTVSLSDMYKTQPNLAPKNVGNTNPVTRAPDKQQRL